MSETQWRFAERYDLLGRLGDGAVGSVWLVRDQRSGAEYAIKILLPELTARPEAAGRLRAHLDAVRALKHPNIVSVDEMFAHEGRVALVMRPVPGDDLRVVLGRCGALAPAHATLLTAQLCDALAVAHAAGLAHGAVKPANVLLEPRPGGEGSIRVGLTDFGMAALAADAGVTALKDEIGPRYSAAMPVEYQAPEIAVGMTASPAADVYAAGVLLYEALSGAAPYLGDFAAVQRQHREAQPRRIPGLPDPLWLLIANCLAKPPQHRPSALDLASLLRNIAPTVASAPAWAMRDAQDTTLMSAATLSSRISREAPPPPGSPLPLPPGPDIRAIMSPAGPDAATRDVARTQGAALVVPGTAAAAETTVLPAVPHQRRDLDLAGGGPGETVVTLGGPGGGAGRGDDGEHAKRRAGLIVLGASVAAVLGATLLFTTLGSGSPKKNTAGDPPGPQPLTTNAPIGDSDATASAVMLPSGSASAGATASPSATASAGASASASASPSASAKASGPAGAPVTTPARRTPSATGSPTPSAAPSTAQPDQPPNVQWFCSTNTSSSVTKKSCIGENDQGVYMQGSYTINRPGTVINGITVTLWNSHQFAYTSASGGCSGATCTYTAGPYNPMDGRYSAIASFSGSSGSVTSQSLRYFQQ